MENHEVLLQFEHPTLGKVTLTEITCECHAGVALTVRDGWLYAKAKSADESTDLGYVHNQPCGSL